MLLLVLVAGAMLVLQLFVLLTDYLANTNLARHPAATAYIEFIAIGTALLARRGVLQGLFRENFSAAQVRLGDIVAIAVTVVGATILISEVANYVMRVVPPPKAFLESAEDLVSGRTSMWGSALALSVVAPVMEEMLFRGVILKGFLTRYSPAKAIVLSSLLFGAFHLNPWQFPGATALGALFGWWFVRTGSLLPCIFGHTYNNSMLFLASVAVMPEIQGFTSDPLSMQTQPLWFDLLGVAITAFGLWLSSHLLRGRPSPYAITREEPTID